MTTLTLVSPPTITTGPGEVVFVSVLVNDDTIPTFRAPDGRRMAAAEDSVNVWTASWATTTTGHFLIQVTAGNATPLVVVVDVETEGPDAPIEYDNDLLNAAYGARDDARDARVGAEEARAAAEVAAEVAADGVLAATSADLAASEAARTQAEAARVDAQVARTGAETARNDAEVARDTTTAIALGDAAAVVAAATTPIRGYDIIAVLGESHPSGRGKPFSLTLDPPHPDIMQMRMTGASAGEIIPAAEPMQAFDAPTGIGIGFQFARRYVADGRLAAGRKALVINAGMGGSRLTAANPGWLPPDGTYLTTFLARLAEARAVPGSKVAAILIWIGTNDSLADVTGPTFQAALDALIDQVRAACGDDATKTTPVVLAQPGGLAELGGAGGHTYREINAVLADTPSRKPQTAFVPAPKGGLQQDKLHFTGPANRIIAASAYAAHRQVSVGLPYDNGGYTGRDPVLDGLANVGGAYAVRRVLTSYTGPLITVRRASDNATLDVGFTAAGDLDVGAAAEFCKNTSGFLSKWWDQSPAAVHIVQATAAAQPKVADPSGLLTALPRNRVFPEYDGVDDHLLRSALLWAAGQSLVSMVYKSTGAGLANARQLQERRSNASQPSYTLLQQSGAGAATLQGATNDAATSMLATTAGPVGLHNDEAHQISILDTGAEYRRYMDGELRQTLPIARAGVTTLDTLHIMCGRGGSNGSVANFQRGGLPELLLFTAAPSDAVRAAVEKDQKAYYGIGV